MTRLRCTKAIQPAFCAFLLHHRWQQGAFFEKCNNHVSQASVGREVLLDTDLTLPPLAEQRRIVTQLRAVLEQVNRAKRRLDQVPVILKRFRQSVLAAACSGELTREWRATHSDDGASLLVTLGAEPVAVEDEPLPKCLQLGGGWRPRIFAISRGQSPTASSSSVIP